MIWRQILGLNTIVSTTRQLNKREKNPLQVELRFKKILSIKKVTHSKLRPAMCPTKYTELMVDSPCTWLSTLINNWPQNQLHCYVSGITGQVNKLPSYGTNIQSFGTEQFRISINLGIGAVSKIKCTRQSVEVKDRGPPEYPEAAGSRTCVVLSCSLSVVTSAGFHCTLARWTLPLLAEGNSLLGVTILWNNPISVKLRC